MMTLDAQIRGYIGTPLLSVLYIIHFIMLFIDLFCWILFILFICLFLLIVYAEVLQRKNRNFVIITTKTYSENSNDNIMHICFLPPRSCRFALHSVCFVWFLYVKATASATVDVSDLRIFFPDTHVKSAQSLSQFH